MFSIAQLGHKLAQGISCYYTISRSICSNSNRFSDGFRRIEKYLIKNRKDLNGYIVLNDNHEEDPIELASTSGRSDEDEEEEEEEDHHQHVFDRSSFIRNAKLGASMALQILQQDGPGFNTKSALDDLQLELSGLLVREVLIGILKNINQSNKERCAILGYKFFVWSGEKQNYKHTVNTYHLIMQIFAESEQYKPIWRLVDEMIDKGYKVTPRTFNILICTCGEAGLAKKAVERFIKSKSFNFRPHTDSFNAILHSLFTINQYKLIEWVYQEMLSKEYEPDTLTYNIIMYTKYKLGKLGQFHRLLDEMGRNGFPHDFHTYNILLHITGKSDKPAVAVDLLNRMKEVGIEPNVLHFTTLIDGLSRAKNMKACEYFFDEMIKQGCEPDVVSYTVMITGYISVGQFEKAEEMFSEMFDNGKIPNVYTYNSMIRGLCMRGEYEYACLMLKEMESRGCNPNFLVYSTLVKYLRSAGKVKEAHEVIKQMVEKRQYHLLLHKLMRYKRC